MEKNILSNERITSGFYLGLWPIISVVIVNELWAIIDIVYRSYDLLLASAVTINCSRWSMPIDHRRRAIRNKETNND